MVVSQDIKVCGTLKNINKIGLFQLKKITGILGQLKTPLFRATSNIMLFVHQESTELRNMKICPIFYTFLGLLGSSSPSIGVPKSSKLQYIYEITGK